MQLPTIFHGRYRDVKPRLRRIAKRMRRGEDWIPLVEQDGFLDFASTPGHIVSDGPNPMIGGQEHFQMWLLWALVRDQWWDPVPEIADNIFRASLTRPWTILGLVMNRSHGWVWDKARHRPFLRAVCPYWEAFAAVGPRYTSGSPTGAHLWEKVTTVAHVLATQGIPYEVVRTPPVPGALAELLQRHGIEPDLSGPEHRAAATQRRARCTT